MCEEQLYERYLPGYMNTNCEQERNRIWEQASAETIYQLSAELQRLRGSGADLISFVHPERSDGPVSAWPDLLSMDIVYWRKHRHWLMEPQNESETSQNSRLGTIGHNQVPENYINQYIGDDIRLFYNSCFVYGRLYSALHYILALAKRQLDRWAHSLYPYQLKMAPHHSANRTGPSVLNTPLPGGDALGSHASVKAYFHQQYTNWISEQYIEWMIVLNAQLNRQTAATYIHQYTDPNGVPCVDFICKNENTLRMIRPNHFVEDIQQMANSSGFLDHELQQIVARIEKQCRSLGW
ncbi:hypothetical protein RJ45_07795 [Photobacterium gaetbulicola]|uniref:Uncharacterized protein n=1 Tax=Photobacterium gaetbulicola TaxID=1295392 RepID=A0A0B9G655_9GAMM|nr:hypothetical protein [Photobacterium gaetbulicola]KHT64173.1 hypothetical protein RJ45_07795 [Photobacterium gaetbulicola]